MPPISRAFRFKQPHPLGHRRRIASTLAWVLLVACNSQETRPPADGHGGEGSCLEGELGCACFGNETCDSGLVCRDQLCETLGMAGDGDGDGDGDGGAGGEEPTDGGSGGRNSGSGGEQTQEGSGGSDGGGGNQASGGHTGNSGGTHSGGGGSEIEGNLIFDGAFDDELEGWVANPDIGQIVSDGAKQRACFSTESNGQFTLAWPDDFAEVFTIKPGVTYQISYRAVSTLGIDVWVQIRQPQEPYTWFFNEVAQLSETWTEHTHTFTLDSGSSNRGIAFIGTMSSPGTTCFDDVVLKEVD